MLLNPHRFGLPPPVLQFVTSVYTDEVSIGGTATATFTLGNNGGAAGGPTLVSGDDSYMWLDQPAQAALYEVVVTMTGGTTFSVGAAGTFNLGATRTFEVTRSTAGTKTATATFEIRAVANPGVVLASGNLTLQAIVD